MAEENPTEYIQYPEHNKLMAVREQAQTCGMFVDWLQSSGRVICTIHSHTDDCYADQDTDHETPLCGCYEGEYTYLGTNTEALLAAYFGINLNTLSDEKKQMLDELRSSVTAVIREKNI